MTQQITTPFSNAQLELLKLFSTDLKDNDLEDLKKILLKFKFQLVTKMADDIWEEKDWTNDDIDRLLKTHKRTVYNSEN